VLALSPAERPLRTEGVVERGLVYMVRRKRL
jgi:hypothetical protein